MNKLKEVLFKRTLMYYTEMNKSTDIEEVGTYTTAYLAVNEVIAEADLYEEFQQWKEQQGGSK